ncbi:MAG TPA: hypothetical protein VHG32_10020, partial [Thermoanaerobaculia bacterium]|nr:hypothetical protein [Thermoanaerobaculia bacterium]
MLRMPHAAPDDSTEPDAGARRRRLLLLLLLRLPRRHRQQLEKRGQRGQRRRRGAAAVLLLGVGVALLAPPRLLPELPAELAAAIAQLEDGDLPPQQALAAARILITRVPAAAAADLPLDSQARRRLLAGLGRAAMAARGAGAPA